MGPLHSRLHFQHVPQGALDRFPPVPVLLDAQNLSRVPCLELRVRHRLPLRTARRTRKAASDLGHHPGKVCDDLGPQYVPCDEQHALASRGVKRAHAQRSDMRTRDVCNVHIVRRKWRGVGDHWSAGWPVQERRDPGKGAKTMLIGRLSASIWPKWESRENCTESQGSGGYQSRARGGGNMLDVTSMRGLASANFQSSRSAMTCAAVWRHQGCSPSFSQSSAV